MSRKVEVTGTRPRPGPRPQRAASPSGTTEQRRSTHGSTRRRTAHTPTAKPKARKAASSKPTARKPTARKAASSKPKTASSKAVVSSPRSIPARRTATSGGEPANPAKWWLLAAIVVGAAFCIAVLEAPFFEAENVQVSGAARTSEGLILDALDIGEDQALLMYDTDEGADRIAALPWVKAVEVTRQWPSTVRVVVRERTVSATVGSPSGREWVVLGEDGVVVESRMTPPTGVPLIVATSQIIESAEIGGELEGIERVLEITQDLPLQLDPWVTTWSVDNDGRVIAKLVGTAYASFGAFEDHRTQFVSLASILDGGASLVCLERIDLTVADTPVLHRNAPCMLEAQELT